MESLGFLSFVILIIGGIIGYIIKSYQEKNKFNWQEKFEATEKELNNTSKQLKKERNKVQQMEQQNGSWKAKYDAQEVKYAPMIEDYNDQINQLRTDANSQQDSYRKLESLYSSQTNQYDKLKKSHQRLQEKYTTDLADTKGWKNTKSSLESEIESHKKKIILGQRKIKELQETLDKQTNRINEANKFASEFRIMKAEKRRLTKDLAYWEKKHYDTHHELASLTKEVEKKDDDYKDLNLRFKGSLIEKENMMKKLEEFKTKFVNANNLYHELKGQKN